MKNHGLNDCRVYVTGVAALVALTMVAVLAALRFPVYPATVAYSPFVLPVSAEVSQTLLPDGTVLEVSGARGRIRILDGARRKELSLPRIRRFGSVTLMPNGQVLFWGGVDEYGKLLEAGEWFDPVTSGFVTTGRLGLPARAGHTMTVLSDGNIMMTGGWGLGDRPTSAAILWSPQDHRTSTLPMDEGHPRFNATAVLEASGIVRIEGGVDDRGHSLGGVWRIDPAHPGAPPAPTPSSSVASVSVSLPNVDTRAAPLLGPLALHFSLPVDMAAVNQKTISLLGPGGILHTRAVPAESGRLVFIQLPDELLPGARYTVFVQGLSTATGAPVPYTAIGFTTRQTSHGVVIAGDGLRPSPSGKTSTQSALVIMAGQGRTKPCTWKDPLRLCRDRGYVKNGAWYPGQDNVADAAGGHWRLYGERSVVPDSKIYEAALDGRVNAVIGQVRQIDEKPIANVEVSVGDRRVRTNEQGVFVLTGITAGRQELFVDGRSASGDAIEYGRFLVGVDVNEGGATRMPYVMYMPRVLARDKIELPSPTIRETVLTHPEMPGLELRIPAGAVFKDREGHIVNELAIVPTPVDRAPFPLPGNFPTYFTIQPGDAVLQGLTPDAAKGLEVVYPNYGRATPADSLDFWVYSVKDGWQMYGAGHTSADASQIVPEAGARLVWALGAGASINPADKPGKNICTDDTEPTADPIDNRTGVFFHEWTDVAITDVLPLMLTRAYRSDDDRSHAFGIGASSNFNIHLYSNDGFATPQLVLPCGEGIRFDLVSGAAHWPLTGTVWQHKSTSSGYYGATLQFIHGTTRESHWMVTTKDGTQYAFDAHAPNALTSLQDRFGNRLQLTYRSGLLDQVISPSGRSLTFTYDQRNHIKAVVDSAGRSTSYTYGADDTLVKVSFPDGTSEHYTYDGAKRLLAIQDRRGHRQATNTYDAVGRVIAQTQADKAVWKLAYGTDTLGRATTLVTDPVGHQRHITYDPVSNNRLTDTRAYGTPLAQTISYTRQASGLVDSSTDALGRVTSFVYDGMGNVVNIERLSGTAKSITHRFTYTADYNLLSSIIDPLGNTTRFDYRNGCLVKVTDPLGHATTIKCNAAGQPTSFTNALGQLTKMSYEGYDLQAVTDAMGRTSEYLTDTLGRTIATKDTSGNVTLTGYDSNDRITETVDGLNAATSIHYDANGNLSRVILPDGAQVNYAYDSRNRLSKRTDALAQAESWAYDGMGNVTSYRDRHGQTTLYSYDALHRRTLTSYADSSGIQASYDKGSRLSELLDSVSGSLKWDYDGLDRVTAATSPQGTVSYTYDPAGRRVAMRPAAQSMATYAYDSANRLVELNQGTESVRFSYDELNRRSHLTLPNGISVAYRYDAVSQLVGMQYTRRDGTVVGDLVYGYDHAGRRITQAGSLASQQLPEATIRSSEFDHNNRLTRFNGSVMRYDINGNLISDGVNTFKWNARHQLAEVTKDGTLLLSYTYDALARRATKKIGAEPPTAYLYDGIDIVQEGFGNKTNSILAGLGVDERFARDDVNGRTYFLTDALGSTVGLADSHGELIKRYEYDPYGNVNELGGAADFSNPYQYTGREADTPELLYFRARYYSPRLARFISEDPIGLAAGPNSYAYVGGDPINRNDPLGLACNGLGCWVTPAERVHADAGDYSRYYETACRGGDPYACSAGKVAGNVGFLSGITNTLLANSIAGNLPKGASCAASTVELQQKMDAIRVGLARAHVDALDGASPNNPKMLERGDISDFHKSVFFANDGGDVFGGDTWDKYMGWTGGVIYDWCPQPSCRP